MKVSKKPVVSIIMNCFNGEKFLNESLQSVINQSFKNWELIFFDNNSTDQSVEIANGFQDKRFKIISTKKHLKLYDARNEALKYVKGKFIAFLDTDDWWTKNKLKNKINLFKKNKKVDLVYSNFYVHDSKKRKNKIFSRKKLSSGFIAKDLLKNYRIFILTVLVKKNLFKKSRFNKKFDIIGDFDFFINQSFNNYYAAIQKPLAYYRHHENNYSKKKILIYYKELKFWLNNFKKKHNKLNYKLDHVKKEIFKTKIKIILKDMLNMGV